MASCPRTHANTLIAIPLAGAIHDAPEIPGPLSKTSADAAWFQQNHCASGNAFSWCLLNRGGGDDWGYSNCKFSSVKIILNRGVQVNFKIKIGGSNTLSTTILNDNYVHNWYNPCKFE